MDTATAFFIDVNFIDGSGFIVDSDPESPIELGAMGFINLSGSTLIDAQIAPDVEGAEAVVNSAFPDLKWEF